MNKDALYVAIVDSLKNLQDVWAIKLLTSFFLAAVYNLHVRFRVAGILL